jgi:1-acyl-sn-glycerol-3-phosphate acyltransferase
MSMRLTLRAAMIVLGLFVGLPLHYSWRLLGKRSPWPRRFLAWVGYASGMRVEVRGEPLPGHVLFVSNHLSWLDIMLIAGASGAAFVSKDEVARWPLIGWLASLNNTIFVARTQRGAVRDQAAALRNALASGQPVALFPEGTTEGGAQILPFRASLLASLYPPLPAVKVQPVALDYGSAADEIAWVGKEAAGANAKRVLSRKGSTRVAITFLGPLDPSEFPDRKALSEAARRSILTALPASEASCNPL